tara:strand:- start:591 stop:809 length:219 start_codon:yes stop_codon:yes gene_type:complete
MVLTLEQIDKRLADIPQQIAKITAEQHQLMGYKQALEDTEAEAAPKNGVTDANFTEVADTKKKSKSKVGKAA